MAPSPQTYGTSTMASYAGQQTGAEQYGGEMPSYEHPAAAQQSGYQAQQHQSSYNRAPSSAQVSTYDERTPAASGYAKQQQSYGGSARAQHYPQQQQHQTSYAAPAAPSAYGAKPAAPKYEEQYVSNRETKFAAQQAVRTTL